MENIEVTSNWSIEKGKIISNCVVVKLDNDESGQGALPQKVVRFYPPDGEIKGKEVPPFKIMMSMKNNTKSLKCGISSIDVLCNARFMEVFSSSLEYVCTEEGIFLEKLGKEVNLYILQHSFEKPSSKTKMKFAGLQNKKEIVVHSIHVSLAPVSAHAATSPFSGAMFAPSFDLEKVKDLLPGTTENLPQGAQSLLKSMETFQNNKSQASQQMGGMAMLMSMFSGLGAAHKQTPNSQASNNTRIQSNLKSTEKDSVDGKTSKEDAQRKHSVDSTLATSSDEKTKSKANQNNTTRRASVNVEVTSDMTTKHVLNNISTVKKGQNDDNDANQVKEVIPESSEKALEKASPESQPKECAQLPGTRPNTREGGSDLLACAHSTNTTDEMNAEHLVGNNVPEDVKTFVKKTIMDSENRLKLHIDSRLNEVKNEISSKLDLLLQAVGSNTVLNKRTAKNELSLD